MTGKQRIGCYGTTPDNPTKAPPRKPAVKDSATQVGSPGGAAQQGAGTGMKKG